VAQAAPIYRGHGANKECKVFRVNKDLRVHRESLEVHLKKAQIILQKQKYRKLLIKLLLSLLMYRRWALNGFN
jgi:hypothetical protein